MATLFKRHFQEINKATIRYEVLSSFIASDLTEVQELLLLLFFLWCLSGNT